MKIVFVGLACDYKDPVRGSSFEFTNFWLSLKGMRGIEATFFPLDEVEARSGRNEMNRILIDRVNEEAPDLVFFFLFEDEIHRSTIEKVSRSTTTLNWFADDHWRFESFSRRWASAFTWVSTTDPQAVAKYRDIGIDRIILTQWACNPNRYRPLGLPTDIAASFVGQAHGSRKHVVGKLRRSGVEVQTWGYGWPEGRLGFEEMLNVFNRSRINLNLSNASHSLSARNLARLPVDMIKATINGHGPAAPLKRLRSAARDQIKGRNFEIPGTGAFLLTNELPELHRYFVPDEEVATFTDISSLIGKIEYYLAHEDERLEIANAGFRRTLAEHTYEQRFRSLFSEMGLS